MRRIYPQIPPTRRTFNGSIDVYPSQGTHLIVDITGYFAPNNGSGLLFNTINPCRAVNFNMSSPNTTATYTQSVGGTCAPAATGSAFAINTSVNPYGATLPYITVWPYGSQLPDVSLLNALEGQVVGNGAIVPSGTGGLLNIFTTTGAWTNLTIDVTGYFKMPPMLPELWKSISYFPKGVDMGNGMQTFAFPFMLYRWYSHGLGNVVPADLDRVKSAGFNVLHLYLWEKNVLPNYQLPTGSEQIGFDLANPATPAVVNPANGQFYSAYPLANGQWRALAV